jgi:4-hydroxy-tetrahydrodipicolinate synthase
MRPFNLPDGIIPPLITPLTEDQQVDVTAMKKLIEKQLQAGIPALFVCGSAGLGSVLTAAEYEKAIATTLDTVPADYPVLVGVLESSTVRCVERIELLESLGIGCFVTVTPYYLKATLDDELLRHFGTLREKTDMEMVLYNMPGCTGVVLQPDLVFEMVRRGWSSVIKDSSGDNTYFNRLCTEGAEFNLKVYQGLNPDFGWLHEIGCCGCVPLPANSHPELFMAAWEARGDDDKLKTIQPQVDEVWNDLIRGTDYLRRSLLVLAEQGIGGGTLNLPFMQYGNT